MFQLSGLARILSTSSTMPWIQQLPSTLNNLPRRRYTVERAEHIIRRFFLLFRHLRVRWASFSFHNDHPGHWQIFLGTSTFPGPCLFSSSSWDLIENFYSCITFDSFSSDLHSFPTPVFAFGGLIVKMAPIPEKDSLFELWI